MREAKYLKKCADNFWKSTEIQPKLLFFFICLSLKPHKIPMKKDNSKFQKQASLLVFWLQFVFSNNHSKSTGSPLREAEVKAVKVVNFVAMWLNLYPRTVGLCLFFGWKVRHPHCSDRCCHWCHQMANNQFGCRWQCDMKDSVAQFSGPVGNFWPLLESKLFSFVWLG